jgi:hypothetical protein
MKDYFFESGKHKGEVVAAFESREEADTFLKECGLVKHKDGYIHSGVFYLHHGEYSSPDYYVRKRKEDDTFLIWKKTYYYGGTLTSDDSRFLNCDELLRMRGN